jgi:hypothetical protein
MLIGDVPAPASLNERHSGDTDFSDNSPIRGGRFGDSFVCLRASLLAIVRSKAKSESVPAFSRILRNFNQVSRDE